MNTMDTTSANNLWPSPRSLRLGTGNIPLGGPVRLTTDADAAKWDLSARLGWLRLAPDDTKEAVRLHIAFDPDLAQEAFVLEIDATAGVSIAAATAEGAGCAIVTLRQLLPADAWRSIGIDRGSWTAPALRIEDAPAYEWRGFLLDVARHFVTKDEVLRLLERMAMHRLNVLQLHLADDQGWRVAIDQFPGLATTGSWRPETAIGLMPFDGSPLEFDGTPHGGFYTLDDLREIAAYATRLGIAVVPEIDLPAHACALMAGIPELVTPGMDVPAVRTSFLPSGRAISPLPQTRWILTEILRQITDAIPGTYLHLGGDEASLTDWEASEEVQRYMADNGLATVGELRQEFNRFLEETAKELGRIPVMWDEAFVAGGLDPSTVVMAWRSPTIGYAAIEAGHDVVLAPTSAVYLDYAEDGDDEPLAIGHGQNMDRVARFCPEPPDGPGRLLGVEAALWSETLPDPRVRSYRTFPRLSVVSANAWTGKATPWPDARPSLEHHLGRLDAAGIEFRPLDGPAPWQRGGTGRRRAVSPLNVAMLEGFMEQSLGSTEMPDFADLDFAELFGGADDLGGPTGTPQP